MNIKSIVGAVAFMAIGASTALIADTSIGIFADASGDQVLAIVNEQPIYRQEVMEAAVDDLAAVDRQVLQQKVTIRRNRHQAIQASINDIAMRRVLAEKAAVAGVTSDEYRQSEFDRLKAEVSNEQVGQMYVQVSRRAEGKTLEQMDDEIRAHFAERQIDDAIMAGATVDIELEPFRISSVADDTETAPTLGPADAPITLVEFSDFQCPYCAHVNPTIYRVAQEYPHQVRIVFRQFPLDSMHPDARVAAEASLCANEQGEFWELHDKMFSAQHELTPQTIRQLASELGLDYNAFGSCMAEGRYKAQVQGDLEAGEIAGVTGTPSIFINGRLLAGAVPFDKIAEVIDDEISRHN